MSYDTTYKTTYTTQHLLGSIKLLKCIIQRQNDKQAYFPDLNTVIVTLLPFYGTGNIKWSSENTGAQENSPNIVQGDGSDADRTKANYRVTQGADQEASDTKTVREADHVEGGGDQAVLEADTEASDGDKTGLEAVAVMTELVQQQSWSGGRPRRRGCPASGLEDGKQS